MYKWDELERSSCSTVQLSDRIAIRGSVNCVTIVQRGVQTPGDRDGSTLGSH